MLNFNENLTPYPLAILTFIESLFTFSFIFSHSSVLIDSWLFGTPSKDSSLSEKPFIYKDIAKEEMAKKREMLLTDDEWLDELDQKPEEPIYSDDHEFVKKRKQRSNEEVSHRNKELEAIHNRNIKERDWDPEEDYKHPDVPTTKRREVRDPNFLDDESTLGSRDESEDIGKLGKLVVFFFFLRKKSEKSINTQESHETTKPEVSGHKDSSNSDWADFIDSLF